MILLCTLLSPLALAEVPLVGVAGVDFVPLSRGDLVAAADGTSSGTGMAEGDGNLTPPLTAWGGLSGERWAVVGGLSVQKQAVRTVLTVEGEGQQRTETMAAGLRPSVDLRYGLRPRSHNEVLPYVHAGLYGVIPLARYESDAWTKEEQEVFDELARQDRARIGALGLRAGVGAEHVWTSGLFVGARSSIVWHRGQYVEDEVISAQVDLQSEVALSFGFEL
jgi:hypothetical protein